MGLAVVVGLADEETDEEFNKIKEEQLQVINKLLASANLPAHVEPAKATADQEVGFDMYGYSGLHYLRRIAAHVWESGNLPEPGDEDAADDPLIEKYNDENIEGGYEPGKNRFDHLMMHSDCEGYYAPIAFNDVLFCDTDTMGKLHGDMLGSSVMLLRECEILAEVLQFPLKEIDPEDEALWDCAGDQGQGEGWKKYGIECFTLKRLHAACEAAIERGALLLFC